MLPLGRRSSRASRPVDIARYGYRSLTYSLSCTLTHSVFPCLVPFLPPSLTPKPSRPLSLQEWADNLKANMLVAFKAAADERHLEGDYWLANILGPAFPAPADMVYAGTEYKEGSSARRNGTSWSSRVSAATGVLSLCVRAPTSHSSLPCRQMCARMIGCCLCAQAAARAEVPDHQCDGAPRWTEVQPCEHGHAQR